MNEKLKSIASYLYKDKKNAIQSCRYHLSQVNRKNQKVVYINKNDTVFVYNITEDEYCCTSVKLWLVIYFV